MRVISSLADIDFGIGRISRRGRDMVIESSADSTIETLVTVTPQDALRSLWKLATSPSVWLFVLTLPIAGLLGNKGASVNTNDWETRRKRTGLNKPW